MAATQVFLDPIQYFSHKDRPHHLLVFSLASSSTAQVEYQFRDNNSHTLLHYLIQLQT
jgi:hypothetical protein